MKAGIGGNFIDILMNMYSEVKFRIKVNSNNVSQSFQSDIGVKQGCVLNPILFNIFLSDLPKMFDHSCSPVYLNNYNISCILYADNLVIMSETREGLQNGLDKLDSYCKKWNLTVNTSKTKAVIFCNGHNIKNTSFTYSNNKPY